MSFLEKLKSGLSKSSSKINEIFNLKKIDELTLDDLEETLLSADFGVAATTKIMAQFATQKIAKDADNTAVRSLLADYIEQILAPCEQTLSFTAATKPYVVMMIGVNGAGKTTTIGKLAAKLKTNGQQVSLIAADTFRAAAVEQLEAWGKKNDIRVFKGTNGCDSAGLCYDGLNAAIKAGDDVVFIDTAGRLQNKTGLMDELKKIVRVIKKIIPQAPHHTLLTLDATTGQNALSQVETFRQIIGIDGLIVTKLDGSAKGGVLVSVAQSQKLPIYYLGLGEKVSDLDVFNAHDYAQNLLGLK